MPGSTAQVEDYFRVTVDIIESLQQAGTNIPLQLGQRIVDRGRAAEGVSDVPLVQAVRSRGRFLPQPVFTEKTDEAFVDLVRTIESEQVATVFDYLHARIRFVD